MLVDSHAHVQDSAFDDDRADVIARARARAVTIITVGIDLATSRAALALAEQYEGVYAAVGVHPHEAATLTAAALDELRRLCLHPKVIAIGETGLDWYRNLSPRKEQEAAFVAQLELAADLDLPVIVHNRQADEDVLRILSNANGIRGVMHAFASTVDVAERALAVGMHIALAGPLTYKNAHVTRAVAQIVPLARLLVETDCPYLPPAPWRGRRNEPAYVQVIAEALAGVRNLSAEDVSQATTANARSLFGLTTNAVADH
jgi:TatD DNase family protein